jgi:putative Mg2+ transporter-C (MgtC) family protein
MEAVPAGQVKLGFGGETRAGNLPIVLSEQISEFPAAENGSEGSCPGNVCTMNELWSDFAAFLHELMPMLLAALCGGVIGLEREMRGKPSGVKTNSLICFGCAAFASVGMALAGPGSDPARVVGQVVTGIGFLGAGAIITQGGHVIGLTTAATIWVTAAVGTAMGLRWYTRGIVWTVLCMVILQFVGLLERRYWSNGKRIQPPV